MTQEKELKEMVCSAKHETVVNDKKENNCNLLETKVYKRRWLMLGLFTLYSGIANSQWLQYSIVANIVSRYLCFFILTNCFREMSF